MKDLKLNHGLRIINSWSFGGTKIEKNKIPSTVTSLDGNAFRGCNLQNITFLGPLQTLSGSVFENCRMLERISLPSELESISQNCFFGCSRLSHVWIPKTMTSIQGGAFSGVDPNCDLVFESGSTIIKERDILYTKGHRSLVAFLGFSGCTEIEVHPDCADIASLAFSAMPVTSVVISKCHIRSIGSGAFSESALVNFSMSDETKALEEKAFFNCKNLTSVRLSRNLSSIGPECFSGCTSLESISIPPSVLAIGERCFRDASKLASVTFEEESQLRTIENEAFAATDIPITLFDIDPRNKHYSTEGSVLFNYDKTSVFFCPKSITDSYEPPSSVTSNGAGTFMASYVDTVIVSKACSNLADMSTISPLTTTWYGIMTS